MRYAPVQPGLDALARYGELFAACFPGAGKFNPPYLAWLYAANPDGVALGYDAWDGERLAAHYVCIPARARLNGADARVLLSLNTATHPDYQGKGLFTRLAALTYEAGAGQGFDGVYGVANANSTPGFVRKLGFQLVRPLEARVGVGPLLHDGEAIRDALSFERCWGADALAWRCANPNNRVWTRAGNGRTQFYAGGFGHALPAYAELPAAGLHAAGNGDAAGGAPAAGGAGDAAVGGLASVGAGRAQASVGAGGARAAQLPAAAEQPPLSPLRLFIGLAPDAGRSYWNYASIPRRLRPSPLNLIWRPLTPHAGPLDPALVRFSFLDFDAY